jgi:hypothetical protein
LTPVRVPVSATAGRLVSGGCDGAKGSSPNAARAIASDGSSSRWQIKITWLCPHLIAENVESARSDVLRKQREDDVNACRGEREQTLDTAGVRRHTDRATDGLIVVDQVSDLNFDVIAHRRIREVEQRREVQVEADEAPWEQPRQSDHLTVGKTNQFGCRARSAQTEVQDRETVRRVESATGDPGALTAARVVLWSYVAPRRAGVRAFGRVVDPAAVQFRR